MNPIMEETMSAVIGERTEYRIHPELVPDAPYETVIPISCDGMSIGSAKTKFFAYLAFPEGADEHSPASCSFTGAGVTPSSRG